ncbi:TcpQ domain-containing protein [Aeromonas veronii]|nr:TcpQ domain-containing protein [Aeromonas veronii]
MRYTNLLIALIAVPFVTNAYLRADGVIGAAGQGDLGRVASEIVPTGWKVKYTDPSLGQVRVDFTVRPWSEQWVSIARQHGLYVLLDGYTKTAVISKSEQGAVGDAYVINSKSQAANDLGWEDLLAKSSESKLPPLSKSAEPNPFVSTATASDVQLAKETASVNTPRATGNSQAIVKQDGFIPLRDVGGNAPTLGAVAAPIARQKVWRAEAGATLKEVLTKWGASENMVVKWETTSNYNIEVQFERTGDFLQAVNDTLFLYKNAEVPLYADAFPGQRLVIISASKKQVGMK